MGSLLGSTSRFEQLEAEVDKCIGEIATTGPKAGYVVAAEECRPSIPETEAFTTWLKDIYKYIYKKDAPHPFAKSAFYHSIIDFEVNETSPELIRFVVMLHHAKEIWDKIPTPDTGHKQPTEELIDAYNILYDTYIKIDSPTAITIISDLRAKLSDERYRDPPWIKAASPYGGLWGQAGHSVCKDMLGPFKAKYPRSKFEREYFNAQEGMAHAAHRQYDNKLLLNDIYGNDNHGSQGYRSQIMGPYNNYNKYNNDKISVDGIGGIRYNNNNGYDWVLIAMNVISLMMVICLLCCIFTIIIGVFGYIAGRCSKKKERKSTIFEAI